jgi:LuxR family maltose regulon positive regulatory protein
LRYRLQREALAFVPDLHRRACRWHVQTGSPDEAMRHALAVPDHDLAADLAEQYMVRMIGSSRLGGYLAWIEPLPDELVHERAYLCAGCGWAYLFTHQLDLALCYAEHGEAALPRYVPVSNSSDGRRISREEVRGHLAAIRAYALRESGDLAGAIDYARRAQEALPPEALSIRCVVALTLGELHQVRGEIVEARQALGEAVKLAEASGENPYVALGATAALGSIALMQGKLNEAEELFERATRYGSSESGALLPVPAARLVHGWLALLHYQRNEIDAAQGHLDRVLEAAEQKGDPQATIRVYLYRSLLDQCRGALDSAETWLQQAEQDMRDHTLRDELQTEWIVFRTKLHLARGEVGAASRLLAAHGVRATDLDGQQIPGRVQGHQPEERLQRYLLLAHVLLAEGAPDQASELLDGICALAQDRPDVAVSLEASSLRAGIAYVYQRDPARALVCLERTLDLAAPEGYVRPFLNVGPLLVMSLRQAIVEGIRPAYAQRLLAALDDQTRQLGAARRSSSSPERVASGATALIEPLTQRERQVLRLLAAGLSSTEVEEELVIAISTARSYIKNLYGKLDAHSRDEAVELGVRYGLIR